MTQCRSLKPVYPGSTIQVKFIPAPDRDRQRREKLDQAPAPKRSGDGAEKRPKTADSPKGADVARGKACPEQSRGMKWLVDVVDENGETVALATILTMVKKLDQN